MNKEIEDFIKQLSVETPLSYEDCRYLIKSIYIHTKEIETAKRIYKNDSIPELIVYEKMLRMGIHLK